MNLSMYDNSRLRFLKIKYDGEEMLLKYERLNKAGQWDEYSLKSRQEPHADFIRDLDNLSLIQVRMCELVEEDSEYDDLDSEMSRHDVRGISLSYGLDDSGKVVMGVTVTSLRRLDQSNAPLTLNSPHKFDRPHTEHGDEDVLIAPEDMDLIRNLCQEALSYIEGKRKQLDMFIEKIEPELQEA